MEGSSTSKYTHTSIQSQGLYWITADYLVGKSPIALVYSWEIGQHVNLVHPPHIPVTE